MGTIVIINADGTSIELSAQELEAYDLKPGQVLTLDGVEISLSDLKKEIEETELASLEKKLKEKSLSTILDSKEEDDEVTILNVDGEEILFDGEGIDAAAGAEEYLEAFAEAYIPEEVEEDKTDEEEEEENDTDEIDDTNDTKNNQAITQANNTNNTNSTESTIQTSPTATTKTTTPTEQITPEEIILSYIVDNSITISEDTSDNTDNITNIQSQIISAELTNALLDTDTLFGSVNGGDTWIEVPSSNINDISISWNTELYTGINDIQFKIVDAQNNQRDIESLEYHLDLEDIQIQSFVSTNTDSDYVSGDIINVTMLVNKKLVEGSTITVVLNTGDTVVLVSNGDNAELSGTFTSSTQDTSNISIVSIVSVNMEDISGRILSNPANAIIPANENLEYDSNLNVDNSTSSTTTPPPVTVTANTSDAQDAINATNQIDIIDGKSDTASKNGDLDGSVGGDILSYSSSDVSIQVDLRNINTDKSIGEFTTSDTFTKYSTGFAFGDIVSNVENFICSNKGDQLVLSEKAYFVIGGNGNDTFIVANDGIYRVDAGGGTNLFVLKGDSSDYTVGPVQGFPQFEQIVGNGITLMYKKTDNEGNSIINNVQFDNTLTSENAVDKLTNSIHNSKLSVSDADTIVEGAEVVFDVNLSNAKAENTSVLLNISGITTADYSELQYKTQNGDWTVFTNGDSVNIPEGDTNLKVKVITSDDNSYEGDETITLTATGTDVQNVDSIGTSIITDEEDGRPTLTVADIIVNENDGTATFTVTLSKAIDANISFDYKTHDGYAKAGVDYESVDGRLTILKGETTVTITVNITDDFRIDNDEQFHLVLHNPTNNVTITDQSATATIVDDKDDTNLSVSEAGDRQYQLELDQTPITNVEVIVEYSGVKDGQNVSGFKTVIIDAGSTNASFDLTAEVDEILSANISSTQGGYLENLTFSPLLASLEISDNTANDSEGSEFIFDVTTSFKKDTDTLVELTFNLEDNYNNQNRMIDNDDYSSLEYSQDGGTTWIAFVNGTEATILANTDGIQVKVVSINDSIKEGDEKITLNAISNDVNIANPNEELSSNVVTIIDDEIKPTLSIDDVIVDEKSGTATFTVTLSESTQHQVAFTYKTIDGTAVAGEDFTGKTNASASINAGELTTTITVNLTDDFYIENIENFQVQLTSSSNNAELSADIIGNVTLTDELKNGAEVDNGVFDEDATKASETKLSISQSKEYIVEGTDEHVKGATFGETPSYTDTSGQNTNIYTISITHAPIEDLIVKVLYSGIAINGDDFTGVTEVTILAGETTATLDVTTIENIDIKEGNESFTITLDSASEHLGLDKSGLEEVVIDTSNASVTTMIADNDIDILTFTSTSDAGIYKVNGEINVELNLDTIVQVGSTINVTLDTGEEITLTALAEGTKLSATYTVKEGQFTSDLSIFKIDSVNLTDVNDKQTTKLESLNVDFDNLDAFRGENNIQVALSSPEVTSMDDAGDNLDNTVSIDGTSYAGATIEIYSVVTTLKKDDNNNDVVDTVGTRSENPIATVTADSNGNWSYKLTGDVAIHDIFAQATTTNLDGEKGNSFDSNVARVFIGDENYDIYSKDSDVNTLPYHIDATHTDPDATTNPINYFSTGHNLDVITGSSNKDIIDGGKNFGDVGNEYEADNLSYANSSTGVKLDLRNLDTTNTIDDRAVGTADSAQDVVKGVENIYGSTHADQFIMSSKAYFVVGDAGDDKFIIVENGTYKISGGEGTDTLVLPGNEEDYTITEISGKLKGVDSDLLQITNGDITVTYPKNDIELILFDSTIDVTDANQIGQYVDGAVVGMEYSSTSGTSGKTGSNGDFEFGNSETITFTVGNISVGTVDTSTISDGLVFLHDIAGLARTITSSEGLSGNDLAKFNHLQNLALFFQTIDDDSNPYNNIVIKDSMITKIDATTVIDLKTATASDVRTWLNTIEGIEPDDIPSTDEALQHVNDMITKHTDGITSFSTFGGTKIIESAPTIDIALSTITPDGQAAYTTTSENKADASSVFLLKGTYTQAYIPTLTVTDSLGRVVLDGVEVDRIVHDNSNTTNRMWEYEISDLLDGTYTLEIKTKDLSTQLDKFISGTGVEEIPEIVDGTISISNDTGILGDNITSEELQTITVELSSELLYDEKLLVTIDGENWIEILAENIVKGADDKIIASIDVTLIEGENKQIQFKLEVGTQAPEFETSTYKYAPVIGTEIVENSIKFIDTNIDDDTITKQQSQTIEITLTQALENGEKLFGSVDGGVTWIELTDVNSETNDENVVTWNTNAVVGTNEIQFKTLNSSDEQIDIKSQEYTLDITIDTPTITTISGDSDNSIETDLIVSDTTPTISGTAEANSTIKITYLAKDGLAHTDEITVDSEGNYILTLSNELNENNTNISIISKDLAGNESAPLIQTITVDTNAPENTTFTVVDSVYDFVKDTVDDDFGKEDNITNSKFINIAIPENNIGYTIKVFIDDSATPVATHVITQGDVSPLSIELPITNDATYNIRTSLTDIAGNESEKTAPFNLTYDTTAPDPTTLNLITGNNTTGFTFSGTASSDNNLEIFDSLTGNSLGKVTTVNQDGTWTFTIGTLAKGEYEFYIKTVDGAGNTVDTTSDTKVIIGDTTSNQYIGLKTLEANTFANNKDFNIIETSDDNDFILAGSGKDTIDGGGGEYDIVYYINSTEAIQVDLRNIGTDKSIGEYTNSSGVEKQSTGDANGDMLTNIKNIVGTAHDDVFILGSELHFVAGYLGSDTFIIAENGTYTILGNYGNDWIENTDFEFDDEGNQVRDKIILPGADINEYHVSYGSMIGGGQSIYIRSLEGSSHDIDISIPSLNNSTPDAASFLEYYDVIFDPTIDTSGTSNTQHGSYVDGAVVGMNYTRTKDSDSSTIESETGSNGEFEYDSNEIISFSIGGLDLGVFDTDDVSADKLIFLHDIVGIKNDAGEFSRDVSDATPEQLLYLQNLSVFLQTMDTDPNPYNNIIIDKTLEQDLQKAITDGKFTVDLKTCTYEELVIDLLTINDSLSENNGDDTRIYGEIPTIEEAMQHLEDMVLKHSSRIGDGSFTKDVEMLPTIDLIASSDSSNSTDNITNSTDLIFKGTHTLEYAVKITIIDKNGNILNDLSGNPMKNLIVKYQDEDNENDVNRLWQFDAVGDYLLLDGKYSIIATTNYDEYIDGKIKGSVISIDVDRSVEAEKITLDSPADDSGVLGDSQTSNTKPKLNIGDINDDILEVEIVGLKDINGDAIPAVLTRTSSNEAWDLTNTGFIIEVIDGVEQISYRPLVDLQESTHRIQVHLEDALGNTSVGANIEVVELVIDKTISDTNLTFDIDTGSSSTDNITSDNTPILTVNNVDADSVSVIISVEGVEFAKATRADLDSDWIVDNTTGTLELVNDSWQYTALEQSDGSTAFKVTVEDDAGNTSEATNEITFDLTKAQTPTLTLVSGDDDTSEETDLIVSDTTPTFKGVGEANTTLELTFTDKDGTSQTETILINENGEYEITLTNELAEGNTSITFVAIDIAGNRSDELVEVITVDTLLPTLLTVSGDEDATDESDLIVADSTPILSGTSKAGTTIEISYTDKNGDSQTDTSVVELDGTYSVTLTHELASGDTNVSIKAIDGVNESAPLAKTITVDTSDVTISDIDISTDTSIDTDFITNTQAQTITATLSEELPVGNTIMASINGGNTWIEIPADNIVGTQITWTNVDLTSGVNDIQLKVVTSLGVDGTVESQEYNLDLEAIKLDSFVSTNTNQSYIDGQEINITLTVNKQLVAGSTLTVILSSGDTVVLTANGNNAVLSGSFIPSNLDVTNLTISSINTISLEDISGRTITTASITDIAYNLHEDSDLNIDNTNDQSTTPTTPNTISTTNDEDTIKATEASDIIDGQGDSANNNGKLDGSVGGDTLSYEDSTQAIQVDLRNVGTTTSIGEFITTDTFTKYSTGFAAGDIVSNIENFQCSNNGDQLILSENIYFVTGGNGADTFVVANAGTYRVNAAGGENLFILAGNEADYTISEVQGFPEYQQITNGDITVMYKTIDNNGDTITNNVQFDNTLTSQNATDKLTDSINNSQLSVSNISDVAEGEELIFDVNLSNAKAGATEVTLNISGIDASDYSSLLYSTDNGDTYTTFNNGASVNIPEGNTNIKVKVVTTNDDIYEGDEVVILSATSADTSIANPNTSVNSTSTISDEEDGRPELSIEDITVNEDGTATFTVTLSKAIASDVSFDYKSHDGVAKAGEDYTSVDGRLTIVAGETTATITVNITDDFRIDNKEDFHIVLHNPTDNVTITDQSATATIIDNESLTNLGVSEASGDKEYTLELDQTPITDVIVEVRYSGVKDGISVDGTKEITIPAGQKTVNFDLLNEVDEILSAGINKTEGGYLENLQFADLQPSLEVSQTTQDAAEGSEFVFDVDLTFKKDTDTNVTLNFALENEYNDQSRLIDTNDYSSLEYSTDGGTSWIVFTNGDTVAILANTNGIQVKVVSLDDTIKEGNETITLSAVSDDAELANANETLASNDVLILDNEIKPELSINDVHVNEKDGTATFTVTLSHTTQHEVRFDYKTIDGNAKAGEDYTSVNASALIPAGQASTTITISLTDDFYIENAENFTVDIIGSSDNAIVPDDAVKISGTATIRAELVAFTSDPALTEPSESIIEITQEKSYVLEGETTSLYTVSIDHAPTEDLVVELVYTGVAQDGTDFTKVVNVTILANETSASFDIATIDANASKEGNEDFAITIKPDQFVVGQAGLEKIVVSDTNGSVTTTIADNDIKILDFNSTSDDTNAYTAGQDINVNVTLDTEVKAGSTINVTLDTGEQITLTALVDGTTLSATYTVKEGQFTTDLSVKSIDAVDMTHSFEVSAGVFEDRKTTYTESLNSNYADLDIAKDLQIDLSSPVVISVNGAGDKDTNTVSLSGSSYSGATVEIYGTLTQVVKDENNNDILGTQGSKAHLGTAIVQADGSWDFDYTGTVGVYDIVAITTATNLDGENGESSDSNDVRIVLGDDNYDIYGENSDIKLTGDLNYVASGHNKDIITAGANADVIDGGKNFGEKGNELEADSVSYKDSDLGITADLRNLNTSNTIDSSGEGYAAGDIISNVENIYGSIKDDTFIMSEKAYFVAGDEGNDTFVIAEAGTYKISGGEGADTIVLPGTADDYNAPVAINGSIQGETNYETITSKDGKISVTYQVDAADTIYYDDTIDVNDPASVGSYIDGAVVGMSYERVGVTNGTGKTGSNGDFEFTKGETVKFTVGNIELGSVDTTSLSDNLVFIHDIAGVARDITSDDGSAAYRHLQNLAVFFQAIDSDENPYNNIVIKDSMITNINAVGTIDLKNATYDELKTWLVSIEGITDTKVPALEEAMDHVNDMVIKHTSEIKSFSDLVGTTIIEMDPTIDVSKATFETVESTTINQADASSSIELTGTYSQAYIPTLTITDSLGRVIKDGIEVIRVVHDNSDTTNRIWTYTVDDLPDGTYSFEIKTLDKSSTLDSFISGTGIEVIPEIVADSINILTDTGISHEDNITNISAQDITATLSQELIYGEKVFGSLNGGTTWEMLSEDEIDGINITWATTLLDGLNQIQFKIEATETQTENGINGDTAEESLDYTLDTVTTAPSVELVTDSGIADDNKSNIGSLSVTQD